MEKGAKWAAIFDFDGVIVNSEKEHEKAWMQVAERRGQTCTREQFLSGFGIKNHRFIAEVLKWTQDPEEIARIIAQKEAIFQEVALKEGVPLIPGVEMCLKMLQEHGIPCVIGSSSILKNIDIVLQRAKIKEYFAAIVSGELVQHGKPDPEVFLRCGEAVKMEPSRCVVIEDAPLGIEAAKRARMFAVAITTTFSKKVFETQEHAPDRIIAHFDELSFAEMNGWF